MINRSQLEISQTSGLSNRDLKAAIIKVFQQVRANGLEINRNIGSLSKKKRHKEEPNGDMTTEKYITKVKVHNQSKNTQGMNSIAERRCQKKLLVNMNTDQ